MRFEENKHWAYQVLMAAVVFFSFLPFAKGQIAADRPALIPMPQKITWNKQNFKTEGNETRIAQRKVASLSGVPFNAKEAYVLKINSDSVVLLATTDEGLFRGQQTIRQLAVNKNGQRFITGCSIVDWPAFSVRGFMQDVGRNFMSLTVLKEQIDVMAAYKYNTFQWHVTDNPGWRLESKKYPELTSAASMSRCPGKYYSQKEFLELVNYCSDRFITLIPELDVPGHCAAFRKAFAIDSMSDQRVKPILLDLIDELCNLVSKEKMPYIHLGTDEVWTSKERPDKGLLDALIERVKYHHREVIVWRPGQNIESDKTSITQLWSEKGEPKEGHRYLDSRFNYLNHLDPLAGVAQLYFERICQSSHGDSLRLGGILCCWNDNNVNNEYDIIRQNPVYPGMLTYSETSWKGQPADLGNQYMAKFPAPDNALFREFQDFEDRLTRHRDLYFAGKPFPYVKQTPMVWKLYGPVEKAEDLAMLGSGSPKIEKHIACLKPVYGGTVILRHQFGYPSYFSENKGTVYASTSIWSPKDQQVGCWIGFHDWSRSGGRRGGPFPVQGQWHTTNPEVWVNQKLIEAPVWKNPGLEAKSEEIPFSDENYSFRRPTEIQLKKGWNKIWLKVPNDGHTWKWMFTFVPVVFDGFKVTEAKGLKYSLDLK